MISEGETETLRELPIASLVKALGIDRLSDEERWQLAEELWNELEAEAERASLSEALKQELDRRVAALDANPGNVTTWEEVLKYVRRPR